MDVSGGGGKCVEPMSECAERHSLGQVEFGSTAGLDIHPVAPIADGRGIALVGDGPLYGHPAAREGIGRVRDVRHDQVGCWRRQDVDDLVEKVVTLIRLNYSAMDKVARIA